jgi:proline iminopeptidase
MLPLAGRADGVSLADEHLLVFWDQRGTGLSRRHDRAEVTLSAYTRDLDDLVAYYSPDAPVSLLGHSWGGTYATLYLNEHPERVRAAALLEPGGLSSALRQDDGVTEQGALLEQIVGPYLGDGSRVDAEHHALADQALVDAILQMNLNPDSDVPYARMGSLALRELEFGELQRPFDFTTRLDRVPFQVLFVAGSDSDSLGQAQQERQSADHNGLTLGQVDRVIPLLVEYFGEH